MHWDLASGRSGAQSEERPVLMRVQQSRKEAILRRVVISTPSVVVRLLAVSLAEDGTVPSEGIIKDVGDGRRLRVRAAGRRKRSGPAFRPSRMVAVISNRNEVPGLAFGVATGLAIRLRLVLAARREEESCALSTLASCP